MTKRKKTILTLVIAISILFFGYMYVCVCVGRYELGALSMFAKVVSRVERIENNITQTETQIGNVEIKERFLSVNEYSRPGRKLENVTNIVIHYTGNPGTTAEANRNYFQSLAYDGSNYASAHFVVGLEGEVVQCIPLDEQAFATRTRNIDTIGIEVCHPDAEGKFSDVTYQTVIDLTAELCKQYGLTENDVIRHYDVTGKICPKYYVMNEDAWRTMIEDIGIKLEQIEER